jgi:glycosyltransferase involved in cell wall biosynthesis
MRYSIVTVNYNDCKGLVRTLRSIVSQRDSDYELIVVDGGSTDGSLAVIEGYGDHIDYWVSEPDKGVYNAMNKGVRQAKGEYVIFMNGGDCFHGPDILERMRGYEEDIICGKVLKGTDTRPSGHRRDEITLVDLMRGSLPHQAMFIRRQLLVDHPYDERYRILSDWKFCIEALVFDNCSFRNSDVIVADYDTTGISTHSNGLLPQERERILQELFPPRIVADYRRLAPVDDELLDQSLLLTQTLRARRWAKRFNRLIINLVNRHK